LHPVDAPASRFRLHPLLASFLDDELRATDPAAWRAAHVAAADVAGRRGDLDLAVFHLRAAEDDARLAALVRAHSAVVLATGETATLYRWLDGLSEARLAAQPRLAVSAAWVASHEGDMVRMERLRLLAGTGGADRDPAAALDLGLLDATVGADGLEAMRGEARRFLGASPPDDVWRVLAHFLEGVASCLLGDHDDGRTALETGERLSVVLGAPTITAHCLAALANLALDDGDQPSAAAFMRRARPLMARHRMDAIATSAPVFTTSAYVFLVEGRIAEARAEAARALRLTALLRPMAPWHAVQGRLALATLSLGLGDVARARALFAEAEQALPAVRESPVLAARLREVRALLDAAGQDVAAGATLTTAEVRVLQYLPTHLSFPEIAAELFVSRHTVKTQALSAYRKLGAHSRGEAIERARELGLLPAR
jgi:LuxR family maltose regulon positive regulatory protein